MPCGRSMGTIRARRRDKTQQQTDSGHGKKERYPDVCMRERERERTGCTHRHVRSRSTLYAHKLHCCIFPHFVSLSFFFSLFVSIFLIDGSHGRGRWVGCGGTEMLLQYGVFIFRVVVLAGTGAGAGADGLEV